MRANTSDLPSALHHISDSIGLEYFRYVPPGMSKFPIACHKLPVFKDPESAVASLPVQSNFHCTVLDMDIEEDRKEYETTMSYLASGYGMRLVHIERTLVEKQKKDLEGNVFTEMVRRIYLEYYAPYRIIPPGKEF